MAEITVTAGNFEDEVLNCELPVLVDFWAPWCGPCRMVTPAVAAIAEEMDGRVRVGKINIDEEQSIARDYNVMSIPTLMVFRNGEVKETMVGVHSKGDIVEMIQNASAD